ncbi:MAG TPA: serpin family protein [Pseudomonadales bacterium]|nr:serpin family protein [Pseudomonadales bacterium]
MKTKVFLFLSLLMGFNFLSSSKAAPSATEQDVVAGNTAFAINLYHQLPAREGNLFFSPYSISTALAMTYGGARGQTAKQMAQALQFTVPDDQLNAGFGALHKELNQVQHAGKIQLSVANSLWPQSGFEFSRTYLDLCRDYYGTDIFPLDYAGHAEDSRQAINRWVEDNTNHKIVDLLGPGSVDGARLVLVNAIYFKGKWAKEFKADATQDEPFYASPTVSVTAPLMHQTDEFGYAEFPGVQVLELPYAGGDLSMLVLLPSGTNSAGSINAIAELEPRATNYDLGQLEAKLTPENLALWTTKLPRQKVEVFLPKFTATSEFSLGGMLGAMGMTDAFDPNKADFSGMDGRKDLYISKVVHKAFVDVNEEGTEAAAATGVIMTLSAALPAPTPVFRADHPFLFLIRDNSTGSILFLGRMANPTP